MSFEEGVPEKFSADGAGMVNLYAILDDILIAYRPVGLFP
jgi:hypothetical protein